LAVPARVREFRCWGEVEMMRPELRIRERGAAEVLVGTMSHCHGAFERLVIGAPAHRGFASTPHR
jgi:hypothetical protein